MILDFPVIFNKIRKPYRWLCLSSYTNNEKEAVQGRNPGRFLAGHVIFAIENAKEVFKTHQRGKESLYV